MSQTIIRQGQEARLLVVDDEISIVDFVSESLAGQGYGVESFVDSKAAFRCLPDKTFDIALIDINMQGIDGVDLSKEIIRTNRETEIIIITGVPDEKNLDPFLRMGLSNFLFKPFNKSQLIYSVYAALHLQRLRKSFRLESNSAKSSKLIGISKSTRDLRHEISTVAKMNIPVLILGDSGTGKEIVAHELHGKSVRSDKKFLPINCALLGELANSELFGHAKGAFTGANVSAAGYVGEANEGTLFLDEIGDLSLDIQAKLLRFLDSGEYMRVGESIVRNADIRIVAATNKDLQQMCRNGDFREDFLYRLAGTTLRTTQLNTRREDVVPLVWHFLAQFGTRQNQTYDISADSCTLLASMDWPGNVRQLKQTLYKISQMAVNGRIVQHDVEGVVGVGQDKVHLTFKEAKRQNVEDFERRYLLRILQISQGNLKKALEISGMHKKNFYTKINSLGLQLRDFHPPTE